MPFVDSPGWDRDWNEHPWHWDFEVSTVSEGHRVVKDVDKNEAKEQGAKLTFGEVQDCGVSRMLYNLGAPHKWKFHDLGMGPGKMLIQAYLQFPNLTCCMGVELAKGRYQLAEGNLRTLMRVGWRGRKFMGIEFKKDQFMKIVELTPNRTPSQGWKVGDKVVAFHPLIRLKKETIPDYSGVIVEILDKEKGLYKVKYNDANVNPNLIARGIQSKYLFVPESVRTCEIWYGSLFDYPNGFDAQICVLETDFPDEMHPELVRCMGKETPVGCTFLTYHNLKKFQCFDWDNLRQLDENVYDNDRYITTWSQGWRFYTWEHCRNQKTAKPYNKPIAKGEFTGGSFSIGDSIIFHAKNEADSKAFGVISKIEFTNGVTTETEAEFDEKKDASSSAAASNNNEIKYLTIRTIRIKEDKTIKDGTIIISNDEVNNGDQIVYTTSFRHRVGKQVCAHLKSSLMQSGNNRLETNYATVIGCHTESLSYIIRYQPTTRKGKGQIDLSMPETCVFNPPKLLFHINQRVMACWTRNAQNKNCIHRYKKFPGRIVGINNDATYVVRFDTNPYLLSLLRPELYPNDYNEKTKQNLNDAAPTVDNDTAGTVREMWITEPSKFIVKQLTELEKKIGVPMYNDEMQYDMCQDWDNRMVLKYIQSLGLFGKKDNEINNDLKSIITKSKMTGKQLYALALEINAMNEKNENDNDNKKNGNSNGKNTSGGSNGKFSRNDLVVFCQKVYDENVKADSSDNNNNGNDEKSEDIIITEFDNFSMSKFDFLNFTSNLIYIKKVYDDDEDDMDDGHVHGPNCNHDHGLPGGINSMDLLNMAQQLNASGDTSLSNMVFQNLRQLRTQYPAAFSDNTNDQDTDRKED